MIDHQAVFAHYNKPVPRYTSYPTAPQFQSGLGPKLFLDMMHGIRENDGISVYIHIPYCDRLCWFCGCHTKHTLKYAPITHYVDHLIHEIHALRAFIKARPKLKHLHFGGGSPSLLKPDDMLRLRQALETVFLFLSDTEISVEIDPGDATDNANSQMFEALEALGLTRASIGVQDFHEDVQKAINRPQSFEQTHKVVEALRQIGISSLNIDALYGLPRQNESRLMDTLEKCVSLAPDRMALFGYAHVPWLKKHQQMIKQDDLPDQNTRYWQARHASDYLYQSGYQPIGIDHFAKPDDSLAVAARQGKLHRNFQGYTTDQCDTMIGLGASSIGRFKGGYVQNVVPIKQYEQRVLKGDISADKGCVITQDDKARAYIIERLMCDFAVDFADIYKRFPHQAEQLFHQAGYFHAHDQLGLTHLDGDIFEISENAREFTRIVASQFDAYFEAGEKQYSKAV